MNLRLDDRGRRAVEEVEERAATALVTALACPEAADPPRSFSCRDLLRVHVEKTTCFVDPTHACRVFADLEQERSYAVTLEYAGVWEYGDNRGHYWRATTVEYGP
jgi:hypothetical protein